MDDNRRQVWTGIGGTLFGVGAADAGGWAIAKAVTPSVDLWPNPWFVGGLAVMVLGAAVLAGVVVSMVRARGHGREMATAMPTSSSIDRRFIPGPNNVAQPFVDFTTKNDAMRVVGAGCLLQAIEVVRPVAKPPIRQADLPATIRLGWGKGKLIVRRFTDTGFVVEERRTSGCDVRVNIYCAAANGPFFRAGVVRKGSGEERTWGDRTDAIARPATVEAKGDIPTPGVQATNLSEPERAVLNLLRSAQSLELQMEELRVSTGLRLEQLEEAVAALEEQGQVVRDKGTAVIHLTAKGTATVTGHRSDGKSGDVTPR